MQKKSLLNLIFQYHLDLKQKMKTTHNKNHLHHYDFIHLQNNMTLHRHQGLLQHLLPVLDVLHGLAGLPGQQGSYGHVLQSRGARHHLRQQSRG